MIYGVLDPAQRTFTFASAGHLWPVVLNGDCVHSVETESGLPLGVAETVFSESTVFLKEGARLLLYSDGISEALNAKQEEYGRERIENSIRARHASTASILDDVMEFSAGEPSKDDATVVLISART